MSHSREIRNSYVSERAIVSLNKKQPAVGAILRQKREEMGITQTAAAKEMGISPEDYSGPAATATGGLTGKTLTVDGSVSVVDDATIKITTDNINGTGTFNIADGGFLYLTGSVASSLSFDIGGGGNLVINNPTQFQGTITAEDDDDSFQAILAGVKGSTPTSCCLGKRSR
jgi:hypothetical protein